MNYEVKQYENSLAIIGMSGRFPKSNNINEYWDMICKGAEGITFLSKDTLKEFMVDDKEINSPNYVPATAILEGYEKFDNIFFDINNREAELMDPQHRLFLQTCWEVLEISGYCSNKTDSVIGVFGGSSMNSFMIHNLMNNREFVDKHEALQHIFVHGNMNDYLCTRVSYKLNLKGPAMTIQTACSTSATATYLACQSLLNYDCDIALAGGVSVKIPQYAGYKVVDGGIFSTDGHCKAFDDNCTGTIFGNGVGVIALKRLSDAISDNDNILAIIRGFGINNDGSSKVGYTAPSVEGQRDAILQAIDFAEVNPEEIGYVEMHGTGTRLGDLIEISAIDSAYKQYTNNNGYCPIGSVKANVGHLNAAAGIASIIKTALIVERGIIPPQAAFETPNKEIAFEKTPFYVNTKLKKWDDTKRIAGVSSFGIGGTNVHFIIENFVDDKQYSDESNYNNIITVSAKTNDSLLNNAQRLRDYLIRDDNINLTNVSKTLLFGRMNFDYRIAFNATSKDEVVQKLDIKISNDNIENLTKNRKIAFLFPGQGIQYPDMFKDLYNSSKWIRNSADKYFNILKEKADFDVEEHKFFENNTNDTKVVQPILFIWEYIISEYLIKLGIIPNIVLGHSLGEYVAACVSKIMKVEDAIDILITRGRLTSKSPEGRMLSVYLSDNEINKYIDENISLSVINSDRNCVISGDILNIEKIKELLIKDQVDYVELKNTRAFHSHLLNPYFNEFANYVNRFELSEPEIELISNVTGKYADSEICTGAYWAKHLCDVVKFKDCAKELIKNDNLVIVEIGTDMLQKLISYQMPKKPKAISVIPKSKSTQRESSKLFDTITFLWELGYEIEWKELLEDFNYGMNYKKTPLPTYSFDYQTFCLGEKAPENNCESSNNINNRKRLSSEYAPPNNEIEADCIKMWEEALGVSNIGIDDDFFEIGGHSLIATQIFTEIREIFDVQIKLSQISSNPTVRMLAAVIAEEIMKKIKA